MISVITSTYNGNKYLEKLLDMIQRNTAKLQQSFPDVQVEYLLVNDSPWEPLVLPKAEALNFTCRVLENPCNYGIHKSRCRGIAESSGELITILDQDDEIRDDFLVSQYTALGDRDMVVSNGIKEFDSYEKAIYRDRLKMSLVNHKLFYLKAANQIVSPGQCMLRKSIIPQVWLDNHQEINGADDLSLWLLLLDRGFRFVKNPEKLYTHKQVGSNLSNSLEKMCQSDLEMCEMFRREKLLPEKDIACRERMCAFLKLCGYRNRPSLKALVRYPDIILVKLFAYYI